MLLLLLLCVELSFDNEVSVGIDPLAEVDASALAVLAAVVVVVVVVVVRVVKELAAVVLSSPLNPLPRLLVLPPLLIQSPKAAAKVRE